MGLGKLFGAAALSGVTVWCGAPVISFYRLGCDTGPSRTLPRYEQKDGGADLRIPGLDYMRSAKLRNCALIPMSEKTGLTNEWAIDCNAAYSESGQFLIRKIMLNDTAKAFGLNRPGQQLRDRVFNAFQG